jgi:hypothetical protein
MTDLPAVVQRYQHAHDHHDADEALATFTTDAVVNDDGHEYRGGVEIRDWLTRASTEFTYTRTLVDAVEIDADTWLVTNHLEGNFPGGVVDLQYRFVVSEGLIRRLDIAP